jgi:hypothetical protein
VTSLRSNSVVVHMREIDKFKRPVRASLHDSGSRFEKRQLLSGRVRHRRKLRQLRADECVERLTEFNPALATLVIDTSLVDPLVRIGDDGCSVAFAPDERDDWIRADSLLEQILIER